MLEKWMEQWAIYEAQLQSYRSNMLSSQSFLLAVAAIFYKKSIVLEIGCAIIAVIQLWYIWYRVILTRARVVDFYKYNLSASFNAEGDQDTHDGNRLEEKRYVQDKELRKRVNDKVDDLKHNFRLTRIKLDIILPISFTLMWALIVTVSMVD